MKITEIIKFEILKLDNQGLSTRKIAKKLGISQKSVYRIVCPSFLNHEREYRNKNREKQNLQKRESYRKNKQDKSEYYQINKVKIAERNKSYYENNKRQILDRNYIYSKKRHKKDRSFALILTQRSRMNGALRGNYKAGRTLDLIGCTSRELKEYLESKFLPGMSWELRNKIHIDHIRPCASFDLSDPEQQKVCFHYSNLQPLWAKDNLRKGFRLDWSPENKV